MQQILSVLFIFLNLFSFAAMGLDKHFAVRGHRRIPEKRLMLLALLGGSFGGTVGMLFFRHKTQHPRFYIGFPLILCAQITLAYIIQKV